MLHGHFLENYSQHDSPIHRLPATVKLAAMLAIVLSVLMVPISHVLFFIAAVFVMLVIAAASLIPGLFLIKRLLILEPMVLGVAILTLFGPHGLHAFVVIVLRSSLCMLAIILLANTTPFSEVLLVLRRMHVPSILVTTLALMHRYLFVLLEESRRMRRARACRTFKTDRGRMWKTLASVMGQLFVRSVDRAERVYAAMCARGWQ